MIKELEIRLKSLTTLVDGADVNEMYAGLCDLQGDVVRAMWQDNVDRVRLGSMYHEIIEVCGNLGVDLSG